MNWVPNYAELERKRFDMLQQVRNIVRAYVSDANEKCEKDLERHFYATGKVVDPSVLSLCGETQLTSTTQKGLVKLMSSEVNRYVKEQYQGRVEVDPYSGKFWIKTATKQ